MLQTPAVSAYKDLRSSTIDTFLSPHLSNLWIILLFAISFLGKSNFVQWINI